MEASRPNVDAWNAAGAAAARSGVTFAPLNELGDTDRINGIIRRVWGSQEVQREWIRAHQHAGAVLIGAESEGELIGYVFGFPGLQDGLHLHSHMLGVVPEWQSRGVGFALKLAQRAATLDAGVDEIRWTYDPLLARNAWFNIMKLGSVGVAFLPDFYGEMTDALNAGDRSDRFEVRWWLHSVRAVRAAVAATPGDPDLAGSVPILRADGDAGAPRPFETGESPGERATVAIPRDHFALRAREAPLAAEWRAAAGRAFVECFAAGLVAGGVTRDGVYVFERLPQGEGR
jgi:predicted GNAT superfamily acetyltransferase